MLQCCHSLSLAVDAFHEAEELCDCRFEQLYEANVDSSAMTPGQMLLMGFAGMFSRLDSDFAALLEAVSAVQTLDMYKKADLVREAAMLQVSYPGMWTVLVAF